MNSDPSTLQNRVHEEETSHLLPEAELIGGLRTSGMVKRHTEGKAAGYRCYSNSEMLKMNYRGLWHSVFDQTYENIELIIVDGNSTDGTLRIIKE